METHLQLIKSFVWSGWVFDYELSAEHDTDKNAFS